MQQYHDSSIETNQALLINPVVKSVEIQLKWLPSLQFSPLLVVLNFICSQFCNPSLSLQPNDDHYCYANPCQPSRSRRPACAPYPWTARPTMPKSWFHEGASERAERANQGLLSVSLSFFNSKDGRGRMVTKLAKPKSDREQLDLTCRLRPFFTRPHVTCLAIDSFIALATAKKRSHSANIDCAIFCTVASLSSVFIAIPTPLVTEVHLQLWLGLGRRIRPLCELWILRPW